MEKLEQALHYCFRDKSLLGNALTHSSFANENRTKCSGSNERLEFLGDSVLGMLVAEHLFKENPKLPEGELTRLRAGLVCEQNLVGVALRLNLGTYLKLGRGEEAGGGRRRTSILADAVEAIIAAIYLDGGVEEANCFIQRFLLEKGKQKVIRDYKTALQELVQRENGQILTYHLMEESGPDHAKAFKVEVRLNGKAVGQGEGHSKKEAEQAAAQAAIQRGLACSD
ncbi:MAG: ribonuclease III [Oscillospiraceae bacterium]|nr:ribonuclease III [Oscillospiraceae bacterium]